MLAEIEDAIVSRIQEVLGDKVRTVETMPGPWDEEMLKQALRKTPGVYVYWDGGGVSRQRNQAALSSTYRVYAVTGHASGQRERRRGGTRQIGAYEILEVAVPALHRYGTGYGSLEFQGVSVLAPASMQRQGLAVYEAQFSLEAAFPALHDAADLADFDIYHARHKVGNEDTRDTETHADIPNE